MAVLASFQFKTILKKDEHRCSGWRQVVYLLSYSFDLESIKMIICLLDSCMKLVTFNNCCSLCKEGMTGT